MMLSDVIELIVVLAIIAITVFCILNRGSIIMPLSWDDEIGDYRKCANCNAYVRQSKGHDESCEKTCPFYPEAKDRKEEE